MAKRSTSDFFQNNGNENDASENIHQAKKKGTNKNDDSKENLTRAVAEGSVNADVVSERYFVDDGVTMVDEYDRNNSDTDDIDCDSSPPPQLKVPTMKFDLFQNVLSEQERSLARNTWPSRGGADTSQTSLENWLSMARPSQLTQEEYAWIQVHNTVPTSRGYESPNAPSSKFDETPYEELLEQLRLDVSSTIIQGVRKGKRQACLNAMMDLATQQGLTVGKWLFFFAPDQADASWERIARATAHGTLGCSAKIAPTKGKGAQQPTVCCVYVKDFNNHDEVKRVLLALEDCSLGFKVRSGFKPDFMTYLGINSTNEWGMPATIFSVKEVKGW